MAFDYDLFVIGGGSGGVRCARIAAGHGARVAIAEERHWGGTCVNVGCVPKKMMVQASEYGDYAEDARGFGWSMTRGTHDWRTLIDAKDQEIARLNGVYVRLLENAGVRRYDGRARFADAHTLLVATADGEQRVTAERIVIAVGGKPAVQPHIDGYDLGIVSDDVFHLRNRPERVTIVGGGYIGVEFAGIFAGLGSRVDMIFRQDLPLRGFDHDLRVGLDAAMEARGITRHKSTLLHKAVRNGEGRRLQLTDGREIDTDLLFFAVGRDANTAPLNLAAAGVDTDEAGRVVVDDEHRSSAAGIFAIGDVSNRLNLTPVAIAEGHRLADRLFGSQPPRSWSIDTTPKAVFFTPPLASVGLSEEEAAANGPADVYSTRFTSMRHTLSKRDRKTMMKLVVDQASQKVVGAHMIGEDAPEMLQGLAIAVTAGLTKQDFDRTVGIHPTAAEEFVTLRTRTRVAGG
jgi:glutathione reductase (NADPH)